jgi:hypothetical protein
MNEGFSLVPRVPRVFIFNPGLGFNKDLKLFLLYLESTDLSAFGRAKAYTLLLPIPGTIFRYPEPQYTVPFTIDGASITEPPLSKVKRTSPVRASSAYIAPEYDPAYKTPFATLTAPGSIAPGVGSGTCHRILPVRGSRAAHEPQLIVGPLFARV